VGGSPARAQARRHLLAFSGTRTYHRMACAIEDAGFEIRDQIGWAYGSGFPKSHNQKGDWKGWGTALKPAWEPICLARKPLSGPSRRTCCKHGDGRAQYRRVPDRW
jgi:site-specific DNA-methyltransferase (adenine-specific)